MKKTSWIGFVSGILAFAFGPGATHAPGADTGAATAVRVPPTRPGPAISKPAASVAPAPTVATRQVAPRSSDESLPPDSLPGECYARVIIPPVYETITEQVVSREAGERIEIVPAEYERATQSVVMREASESIEVVPAVYKTVTEQILIRPAGTVQIPVEAEYQTLTDRVLVKAEHTVWKKGGDPLQQLAGSTGEIMCLVTVPAEYRDVTRTVLVRPAGTRLSEVPAEYQTVTKTVVVTPSFTRKVAIPAAMGAVAVTRLKAPEQRRVFKTPAETRTVTRQIIREPSRTGWKRILCETNVTPSIIVDLQTKLAAVGHYKGPIDGIIGSKTLAAVSAHQISKGLSTGGLTYETLQDLNIRL